MRNCHSPSPSQQKIPKSNPLTNSPGQAPKKMSLKSTKTDSSPQPVKAQQPSPPPAVKTTPQQTPSKSQSPKKNQNPKYCLSPCKGRLIRTTYGQVTPSRCHGKQSMLMK